MLRGGLGSVNRPATAVRCFRILNFITSLETGGTETQLVELLKHVDHERFDVRLACIHKRGSLYAEAVRLCGELPEFPLRRLYDFNALAQVVKLRSLLLAQKIDILHTHDFYSGVLGSMAAKLAGVRVLASQRHVKLSDRRVHDWGTRLIHRLSDRILVNSEAVRESVLAMGVAGGKKIIVVHNGLRAAEHRHDCSRAETRAGLLEELGLNEPVRLAVTIARLDGVKGHRFLLEAAATARRTHPFIHYVMIGNGPIGPDIRSRASMLGLENRIHMLGERADVLDILPGFDLSILPSLHEGFPNAVMESMAAGVPVISTGVGGVLELIKDNVTGYLVPAMDAAALSGKIAFAIDHPDLTAAVALRGREFVTSRFGMARMIASVEEIYERIIMERCDSSFVRR
jgi:glycosyltransferase involved in cell wall biosynthesis